MTFGEEIFLEAKSWTKPRTPYQHQGRFKGCGVDCVGLVLGVAKALGVRIEDRPGYSEMFPNAEWLKEELLKQFDPVDEPEIGSLLLLNMGAPMPSHLAIMGETTIIHVWGQRGAVEHTLNDAWEKRIVAAFRFRSEKWHR